MRRRRLRLALSVTVLLLLALAVRSPGTRACGPFSLRAVFVLQSHPDFPLDAFAAGKLGIVTSSWARSQLFVAYRYLSGVPLTTAEQSGVLALWSARLYPEPQGSGTAEAWRKARAAVPGAAPVEPFEVFRFVEATFASYLNCPDDAFASATRTLGARIEQFGASSEAVGEWLRAQDKVFANCEASSGSASSPPLPGPAPPTLPALVRADRDYQVASALFYAGRFEEAARAFGAIAADSTSPWRPLGRYLEARALVRRGTVDDVPAALSRAEALLRQLAADPREAALLPAVSRLLAFVRVRTAPPERTRELAALLVKPPARRGRQAGIVGLHGPARPAGAADRPGARRGAKWCQGAGRHPHPPGRRRPDGLDPDLPGIPPRRRAPRGGTLATDAIGRVARRRRRRRGRPRRHRARADCRRARPRTRVAGLPDRRVSRRPAADGERPGRRRPGVARRLAASRPGRVAVVRRERGARPAGGAGTRRRGVLLLQPAQANAHDLRHRRPRTPGAGRGRPRGGAIPGTRRKASRCLPVRRRRGRRRQHPAAARPGRATRRLEGAPPGVAR